MDLSTPDLRSAAEQDLSPPVAIQRPNEPDPINRSLSMLHDPDFHPQRTLNYTLLALLGVVAGFIIGYLVGQAPSAFESGKSSSHARTIEP